MRSVAMWRRVWRRLLTVDGVSVSNDAPIDERATVVLTDANACIEHIEPRACGAVPDMRHARHECGMVGKVNQRCWGVAPNGADRIGVDI